MNGLTARERRLVALVILVALVAAVWTLGAAPVIDGFARRGEARVGGLDELARDDRLIAAYPRARAAAASLRRSAAAYALTAASPAAAAALARDRLTRRIAGAGGVLRAVRNQPAPPGLVRLQAELRASERGLDELLRQLESDRPFAVVDALSVAAAEPATGDAGAPTLEIRLDLSYSYAP